MVERFVGIDLGDWENYGFIFIKEVYKDFIFSVPNPTNPLWSKAWHKSIPMKVSCHVWRLFQNILATKDNLFRRSVIRRNSLDCVREYGCEESVSHLFFECSFFAGLWKSVCRWLRINTALHKDGLAHYLQFEGINGGGKAVLTKFCVVWLECAWSI